MGHLPRAGDYRTLTYEVTDRIARIAFNRPDQGNAIMSDTPRELAEAVERADIDPAVHVILLSGRGKGFCGGYDLNVFAENSANPVARRGFGRHRTRPRDPDGEPRPEPSLGPDGRLRHDEPLQPRLRQPPVRQQADGREAARLRRRGRIRHRSVRRPDHLRRRRPHRLSARAGGAFRRPACGHTGSATPARSACSSPAT